ncbi:sensor domain-containing protein [Nocardioides panaciterrulae]|uniref:Diguanylate cyclase (GGDEF)-like protein/PAS domain S-box-containing protein n=1 Tax=Nocardioides panaciterrulae TaxID=661492 RepID=A0A7Y9E7W7_9ACTN|nr:EAL domain-containing protein [Nocardioides panaciterrulae]NYD42859.1 diguanylate cyclase (GGDEF)-like protein/PAS domain S-box-containing protein [Nocardioides panaciterrulae]
MHAHDALLATSTGSGLVRTVVETSLPAASLALDGHLVDANDALCRLVGRRRDELVGCDLRALSAYPTDAQRGRRALAAARAGTPCGGFTQRWSVGDGRPTLRMRLVWTLVRDARGAPESLLVLCLDEARETAGARFWEALLAESADPAWTADEHGVLLTATPATVRHVGRPLDALLGSSVLELAHPEDRAALRDAWARLLRGSGQEVLEFRLADARRGWSLVRQVLTDHRGDPEVAASVGNAHDVQELREAERAQGLAASRIRTLFDRSPVPQLLWDRSGRLTAVNAALCTLVDRTETELVGRPARELLHRSDPGGADALDGLLPGSGGLVCERVLERRDGRGVPAVVSGTVLHDRTGRATGVVASVQDLPALREVEARRDRQESFFLALAQRAGDLAVVTDPAGLVVYVSPAAAALAGRAAEDVPGTLGGGLLHPDARRPVAVALARVLRRGGSAGVPLRIRDAHGAWHWLEATATNLLDTAVGGVLWNLRDVDDRVRAEAALRASESRYRAIADNAEEGLCVFTPDGRSVYVNARLREMLGLDGVRLGDRCLVELLDADGRLAAGATPTPERRPQRYEVEYFHPDGRRRTLRVSAAPLDDAGGASEGSLAMVSDVTDARRLEDELRRAALHDSLTGLPNRALLFDRLERALVRETGATAVLLVDLDRFKIVNDVWGHVAGDELLVHVATRLQAVVRPTDTVARFADDEFLVVCESVDQEEACELARAVQHTLASPYRVSEGEVTLTASVGVATSPAATVEELLNHADIALHAAKSAGGHAVRAFDAVLAADAAERQRLGGDLRRALEDDELTLHHQPVVDLATGRVIGTEALARWTHPVHGVVTPDRFVPVAEQVGLAPQLDRWALRRALADARELRASGAMGPDSYVAVNFSARTLGDPELDRWIATTVAEAGFEPAHVLVEVTESAIMADTTTAVGVLTRLRERGFPIAVDDFGTGHSSLAYLRSLPLSVLKIDRSFVAEIATDPSALAIAASIVDLARAVGLTVVAEGVETEQHAELLQGLGCEAAQGWLWSKAVPCAEAVATGALTRRYELPGTAATR